MSFFRRLSSKSPQHQPGSPGHGAQLQLTRQTSASSVGSSSSVELNNGDLQVKIPPTESQTVTGGARPKVLLLQPEDSKVSSNTGATSNLAVHTPVQTSSRLSKTFQEIIHDSNALQCLLQYLDSQGVGQLLQFWHDANSFQASTLTRIHSHSVCYQASPALSETETDSSVSSPSHSEQTDMTLKLVGDSSEKVKVTGSEAGSSSSPPVASSVWAGRGTCDAGQTPNSFDSSQHGNTQQHSAASDNPPTVLASVDSFNKSIGAGQSNTDSAVVSAAHTASAKSMCNPAEHFQLYESKGATSRSPSDGAYISCHEPESLMSSSSSSSLSSISKEVTASPVHLLTPANSSSYPVRKLTLHERLLKSIEDDAIKIYSKYISLDATHPIGITDQLRNETISKICCEDGHVDPRCFVPCQEFVMDRIEREYYKDFIQSPYYCMHQIHVLTHSQVNLADILYNESAIVYFMEFMEREDAMNLLQCWLELDSFQQQLAEQHGQYDTQQAQNDAMVIYDKYFSLQASQPLGFEDDIRFEVECNICKQGGPLADCFVKPKRLLLRTIDKLYFQQYIKSDLYYKYLSDLISAVQSAQDFPPLRRNRSGSDASSEKSVGSQSTGSEAISSKNTLLAMDTSGLHIKKALKKIDVDMRINRDLLDPDALWRREQAGKMSFGRMNHLGQFISEFDRDPDVERKKGGTFFKRKREKEQEEERLALQIASMIISDITSMTSQNSGTCQ